MWCCCNKCNNNLVCGSGFGTRQWGEGARFHEVHGEEDHIAGNGLSVVILVKAPKREEGWRDTLHLRLLGGYLRNHEPNVGRDVDGRGHSDESDGLISHSDGLK